MAGICREIERELFTPAGRVSPAAMAGHLDGCASCARIAARAGKLDAAWSTTQPDEPSEPAWNSAWLGISEALENPTPTVLTLTGKPYRRRYLARNAWIGLALAASLLLALGLAFRTTPSEQGAAPLAPTELAQVDFPAQIEVVDGETSILRFDGLGGLTVETLDDGDEVGLSNDIFNALESEAVPALAIRQAGSFEAPFGASRILAD